MAIESFDDLIGTWAPARADRSGMESERELFHFSPLGHFVMEWRDAVRPHRQICEVSMTDTGFAFTDRAAGTATELVASLEGERLVLVPPHGEKTILQRVSEEMEAEGFEFFVKGD